MFDLLKLLTLDGEEFAVANYVDDNIAATTNPQPKI